VSTAIEWADESWNPLRARLRPRPCNKCLVGEVPCVGKEGGCKCGCHILDGKAGWHCEKVAPECANCYAEHMNVENGKNPARMGTGVRYAADQTPLIEHYLHAETLVAPLKWKKPKRIFPCSMTDLYGAWVPDSILDQIYAVMALTPHTYIVLTKRPERRREYLNRPFDAVAEAAGKLLASEQGHGARLSMSLRWPLPNVIEMGSFGTQAQADRVAPILATTPASRIGVSCEPLLEMVELPACLLADTPATLLTPRSRRLSWLIAGGESGESARPMDVTWARSLRRRCGENQIPFFMKQLGRNVFEADRRIKLRDKYKGGDFHEFPDDLQWRQEPAEAIAA
jgi:protein gp37